MEDLTALRGAIDGIDRQLLDLFVRRMDITRQVGEYKLANGLPVLDAQREEEVLAQKKTLAPAHLAHETAAFFTALMAISRRQQRQLMGELSADYRRYEDQLKQGATAPCDQPRILYQGVPGAYAQEAALAFFGKTAPCQPAPTWEEVFLALRRGEADYGVVPIENSSTGGITQVYDLLAEHGAFITGEIKLKIDHCLMAPHGATLDTITHVYSHEQGLFQCAPFLKSHPTWEKTPLANTAAAAQFVAQSGEVSLAAIGSVQAAQLYGLTVLQPHISVSDQNFTRFVVVAPRLELGRERNKISVLFTLPHRSGTLYDILSIFARAGCNVMKLESRPIPGRSWEYLFFVDFSGNLQDEAVHGVVEELTQCADGFRLLGNFMGQDGAAQ